MSGKAVRETMGFLAVVAGLVFVGLEVRQNTIATRGQTRQSLNSDYVEFLMAIATSPDLFQQYNDQFLSGSSNAGSFAMMARLRNLENVFLQVQERAVGPSVLATYGWTDSQSLGSQAFRDWWPTRRSRFDLGFVAELEAEYDLAP